MPSTQKDLIRYSIELKPSRVWFRKKRAVHVEVYEIDSVPPSYRRLCDDSVRRLDDTVKVDDTVHLCVLCVNTPIAFQC